MTVSKKQLEANRKNAKLGGVKTEQGKAVSKYNALKHGLLSEDTLLKDEDESKLEALGKGIREALKPANALEHMLVERIITNLWRLKRAVRIEKEMIENSVGKKDYLIKIKERTLGYVYQWDLAEKSAFLPFLRYESSIERALYKALHELERLQAIRKGEKIPKPIAVDVSVNEDKQNGFVS